MYLKCIHRCLCEYYMFNYLKSRSGIFRVTRPLMDAFEYFPTSLNAVDIIMNW